MTVRLLLASRNAKKLRELRQVVADAGIVGLEVVGLDEVPDFEELPEDAPSFEGNALIKARQGFERTGLPCLADDSGICVDALNGMPGVLSARWSGRHGDDPANTALLLAQISDTPDERRGAEFVSACALVDGSGELTVRGTWPGTVLREARGEGGFGYDPVFLPEGSDRTAAELTAEEKNAISHRARALAQLVEPLRALAARVPE
ncbi:RdgB/HAM1 family non-canonical purine NTP pyrophosphatase [Tsukamurella tyrosinosolvens]|uniref:RdgB/HAM1 family non-canonical purine NTP pyrophosphatase n=1 Tax=Tsukamurella tyrosinosolvens TaxID=57704 RepID=UPI0007912D00|nr:RdgB/HAM1 family non-canonical purine NTP pyrophosphatase [Tsukamurella tyrosinosolvens]KXP05292.1 non-canonical purine NTP pyrophosphatase [Tsukamurella tyrosinosolvens]KZL94694.1 non-canonical purine NTP pyrophosphatase [Tsukamurella tyrosinosolvens]MCA4994166.1 RdgB/HAM1 family non-canonical purine NTP pyrophosphatase [Tsukamurella tyrosinosolvens]RDB47436.1 RdgB/HAM1 family non-canonical purine NTP pyrophosphatase [Tsukamurella tyrosinosolvens]WEL94452.1 RdgB/HAM1 family non-canonical p